MWALLVFARVVEEQACCGRVCLRVAGFRVYVRGVFVWVFALFGVGALVGWWDSVVPPPLITLTAFWRVGFWCSRFWCGRCWRVRGAVLRGQR